MLGNIEEVYSNQAIDGIYDGIVGIGKGVAVMLSLLVSTVAARYVDPRLAPVPSILLGAGIASGVTSMTLQKPITKITNGISNHFSEKKLEKQTKRLNSLEEELFSKIDKYCVEEDLKKLNLEFETETIMYMPKRGLRSSKKGVEGVEGVLYTIKKDGEEMVSIMNSKFKNHLYTMSDHDSDIEDLIKKIESILKDIPKINNNPSIGM
jgi:hypothetical protein